MKLRPITVMAVLMAVVVLVVGLLAWHHRSGSVAAGQPAELPIRAEGTAPAAAAMAPASTVDGEDGAVTYVAAPGLPARDGTARAWRLAPTAVTSVTVKRLADAIGLSGPVAAQGGGWTVTGSALRSLTVSRSQPAGPWTWTMTGVAVSVSPICVVPMVTPTIGNDGPVPSSPGPVCNSPVTTVPAIPSDPPPSSAQAEARARSILTGAGYDLSGWTLTATVSGDATQVMATPGLDGAALDPASWGSASVGASLYFAPGGEVSSASGSWTQPVEVDAYPLIGTAAGIAALNQGGGLPEVQPMVAASVTSRQVRIDRAELVLEPMAGTDGATWLIPAYRFTSSTTTGTWTVPAIDPKWFDPGAPTGTDTTETVGTGGESSGSPPATTPGSSVVSPPASTVVSPPATPSTTVAPSAPTG